MKNVTKKWISFAKRDLKDAEVLFKNKRYFGCLYYCHQAIEKFLKAIINVKGKRVPKIHDLSRLLNESEVKISKEILGFIQELNPYYQPIRYPDVPEAISLKLRYKKAKRFLEMTKQTIKWLNLYLRG